MENKIYIGVIGQIASGKRVLTDYLIEKYGFTPFSLSSIVHQELKRQGIKSFSRKTLQDIGDELRRNYGDDILARKIIELIEKNHSSAKRIVIEGIRNPAEVEFFKKIPHFVLIGVKAGRRIRFNRLKVRNKSWDPTAWREFLAIDRRDWGVGQEKSGQRVGDCMRLADYVLVNNGTIEEFRKKIEKLLCHPGNMIFSSARS